MAKEVQGEKYKTENKKIAVNTMFLYFQMFSTLFISLYSSRIVLDVLGVSDYGIYGVVGGVLSLFTFLVGSFNAATTRFLNAEMGRPDGDVNKIFNVNQALHFFLAVVIFILAETVGLWYVVNKLNVESGKIDDAIFVYQVCVVTTCLGINNTPWMSLFSAHEEFKFIAIFDVCNLFLRFFCILLLQLKIGNSLRLYALIMCLTTVNTFVVYHWLGRKKWRNITQFRLVKNLESYKSVVSFGGWNVLSTLSFMARSTGTDLMFNSFFGTAVNGAYAISRQANNHITAFSTTFDAASGPQIVQSYNRGDYVRSYYIANKLGRIALLLFEVVFFPLYIELPLLLELWLDNVPNGVLDFMRINLIMCGFSLTCGGFNQIISASGKIKWFKIEISIFYLLCIPIGYFLLINGFPPMFLLYSFFIADILQRFVQMILLKKLLNFDSLKYVREAWLRPFAIALVMGVFLYIYGKMNVDNIMLRFLSIFVCFLFTVFLVYFFGLTKGEKGKIIGKLQKFL